MSESTSGDRLCVRLHDLVPFRPPKAGQNRHFPCNRAVAASVGSGPASAPAHPDPLLGVPADRGGRPRAPRAQALRGPRGAGRRGPRPHARRARARLPEEVRAGVRVHRMRRAARCPRDLDEFVAWVEGMNEHMRAAGRAARPSATTSTSSTATTGSSRRAAAALARAARRPVPDDGPRHRVRPPPGLGRQAPAVLHPRRRALDGAPRRRRHRLQPLHARPRRRRVRHRRDARSGHPQRHRPGGPRAGRRPRGAARPLRRPDEKLVLLIGRLVYEKGFQIALDALPRVIARLDGVRFLVAGSGTHEAELSSRPAARPRGPRHVPGLDRRRRPALALPDRRPVRGAVDLRAVRHRRARGDGQRLPVHRRRHRRPARGRPQRRRRPALPLTRPALAGADDGAGPRPTRRCATASSPRPRRTSLRFDWADVARRTDEVYDAVAARGAKRRPATLGRTR